MLIEYTSEGVNGVYALKVGCRAQIAPEALPRAVAAAADADVAIVIVGTTHEWESEGFDRRTLALPGQQDQLIEQVAAANPNTIVVVNTGAPVTMPWSDAVNAIVQLWFGGQEMANALADVVTGAVDPGGRLPTTMPLQLEHNPSFGNFPGEYDEVRYGEGLLVGYRWYEARRLPVRFPFGHGLSYSSFEIGVPTLSSNTFRSGGTLEIDVSVTNTGDRAGSEVVQCYVAPARSKVVRPMKELKAFAKVHLAPGETQTVTLTLTDRSFAHWDRGSGQRAALKARLPFADMMAESTTRTAGWRVLPGDYVLLIGRSSADIAHTVPITVDCLAARLPPSFSGDSKRGGVVWRAHVGVPREEQGDHGVHEQHRRDRCGVDDAAGDEVAEPDGAAEAHDPQRHHSSSHRVVEPLLQRREQRRDHREVEEAEDGDDGIRRAGGAQDGKHREDDGVPEHPDAHHPRTRLASEQGADRQRAAQRAHAERGVEQAVARRVGLDPVVLLGDDRQLADERERERREEEDRDEAAADDAIGPGNPQADRELTKSPRSRANRNRPSAGAERPGARR